MECIEKLNQDMKQYVQVRSSHFITPDFTSHPMEAVGATKELLDKLVVSQFGDVGGSHSQQLMASNSHRLVNGRELLFPCGMHFFLKWKKTHTPVERLQGPYKI